MQFEKKGLEHDTQKIKIVFSRSQQNVQILKKIRTSLRKGYERLHIYIYMQPNLFWVITFDLDMINTQIGFHSKAEMLVHNIWGVGLILSKIFRAGLSSPWATFEEPCLVWGPLA